MNGRSASDLAALEPGVETTRTQSSGQGKYGFGTQMIFPVAGRVQNDARLDGISVNDYANGSGVAEPAMQSHHPLRVALVTEHRESSPAT